MQMGQCIWSVTGRWSGHIVSSFILKLGKYYPRGHSSICKHFIKTHSMCRCFFTASSPEGSASAPVRIASKITNISPASMEHGTWQQYACQHMHPTSTFSYCHAAIATMCRLPASVMMYPVLLIFRHHFLLQKSAAPIATLKSIGSTFSDLP